MSDDQLDELGQIADEIDNLAMGRDGTTDAGRVSY
jgi:hypothetical protein